MLILIHTSKTMRPVVTEDNIQHLSKPQLLESASEMAAYLKSLSPSDVARIMKISPKLAHETCTLISGWSGSPKYQRAAVDSFIGDIYSGLQAQRWSVADRRYADQHLRILSGLYGTLRPFDGIYPYRLEMAYRLPDEPFKSLYAYWGDRIAKALPSTETIVNLAAAEYSKAVLPHLGPSAKVVTPQFMTISPKTGQPVFVVVHAKIARGAFAGWMIRQRVDNPTSLTRFNQLGYVYDRESSTDDSPVFICREFGGLGLSVRLS